MHIRPAQPADALAIAELTRIASGGLVDFLFDGLGISEEIPQVLANEIAAEESAISYKKTMVAVLDGDASNPVVGAVTSFPASEHRLTEEMEQFFPHNYLKVLEEFYQTRVENSWFMDTLAVREEFRGQGIGGQLIAVTKQRAKSEGFSALSLMAWADNIGAIRLYQRQGFTSVRPVRIGEHPKLLPGRNFILMNCPV
ncbi:MAG: GNAT family N-acetyltransferase [Microcoleaceae cyanobacterium]